MPEFVVQFGNVGRPPEPDGRLDAPAFHRNYDPIWSVLGPYLAAAGGDALEVGSGTGQHTIAFARGAPGLTWWPSDYNEAHLKSIDAWRAHAGLANLRRAVRVDLSSPEWLRSLPEAMPRRLAAIICINVLHIAPWQVAENLLSGASQLLTADGHLFIYGPFMRNGRHTAESNAAFDASLRKSNPEWGVRDANDISAEAERCGLKLDKVFAMPANNFVLVLSRLA